MQYLSFVDIEKGVKRGIYRFLNKADGTALVWDAEKRRYVGHVELPGVQQAAQQAGIDIGQWVGYREGSNWGGNGW